MKIISAIVLCAMTATAVPAVAQTYTGSETTTRPDGQAGSTSGTDAKNGMMTEGRASAMDRFDNRGSYDNYGDRPYRGYHNGPAMGGYNSANSGYENGNMAPGGGPGIHD
jgi:hypothetical protein